MTLNLLDVAGNLRLTQAMIDDFVAKNPEIVSRVTYEKATGGRGEGAAGRRADGAVVRASSLLVLLVIALRFVDPTQLVARVKETPEP